MTTLTRLPQIYVACLASYSSGRLHGQWIDATQDPDDIMADIKAMLKDSPQPEAEEWAIHDSENFHGYSLGENPDLKEVSAIAQGIWQHGAAYAAYVKWRHEVSDEPPTVEHFEDCYCQKWDSERDFALKSDEIEERYGYENLPDFWQNHIDWDSVAEEIFMQDYHAESADPCGIYVFRTDY